MTSATPVKKFNRLLLTGAAGGLGRVLREKIKPWANIVRVSDLAGLGEAGEGEEVVHCDLADREGVNALVKDCDAVLHFGGVSVEGPFDPIMQANILGAYNLYAAIHQHGVKRVVFASSSHTVGFYRTTDRVDAEMPLRPDGFYGLSKCFGEALSRYYFDRFGIETVCLRIGSSFPEPRTPRMMVTYLSYNDLLDLIRASLFTPRVGHTISFGTSANATSWWDNSKAAHLGYQPKDSAQQFSANFPDTAEFPAADDATTIFQGGAFVTTGPIY